MKTIELTLYSAQELKDSYPAAFARALSDYQNEDCNEIPWQDETIGSLKTIIKDAGLSLSDWSLGAYNRGNHITVEFSQDEVSEFTGRRAFAWLENNLLSGYRIPIQPAAHPERRKRLGYMRGYSGCHPLGSWNFYEPGRIAPCPVTGYCADGEYLDALRQSLRDGRTLKQAFEDLADVCMNLLERDAEANANEESFLERADIGEWQCTDDGKRYDS